MKTPLAIGQILAWADAHRRATGQWPTQSSGPVAKAPGENWAAVNDALKTGYRGLPGGSSLARLLAKHRNRRNLRAMPKLTIPQILAWADAHYRRQGSWPTKTSGPVAESPAENWGTINAALRIGRRGLPGGLSLPKLLAEHRGRQPGGKSRLSIRQILEWADAHCQRTGDWPVAHAGPVHDAPSENWLAIDCALRDGLRGLRRHRSLARLLEKHRGRRHRKQPPPLSIEQILAWADAHRRRTGRYANLGSGAVYDAEDENWEAINSALKTGARGLPLGWTLHRLLVKYRGKPPGKREQNPGRRPRGPVRRPPGGCPGGTCPKAQSGAAHPGRQTSASPSPTVAEQAGGRGKQEPDREGFGNRG
jgi:hypothetical protein